MEDLKIIQSLVGNITKEDLKCVDYYGISGFGICIPAVGFCKYAIKLNHTHPAYSFVIFFSHEDVFFYGEDIKAKKNHYITGVISPNVPHEEPIKDSFTRYVAIFIDKDFFESKYASYCDYIEIYNKKLIQIHKNIMMYIEEFIRESKSNFPNREEVLKSNSVIITNMLIREIRKMKIEESNISEKFEINKVIEYMNQNYGHRLSDKVLADISKMGESYFIHTFKKEIGITPMDYLSRVRIEKAKKLLEGNEHNITEIALICGYNSLSYFSYVFKKGEKMSPSQYRNNHRLIR